LVIQILLIIDHQVSNYKLKIEVLATFFHIIITEKQLPCKDCGKIFYSEQGLYDHMNDVHKPVPNKGPPNSGKK
jgi:hypothetical protein